MDNNQGTPDAFEQEHLIVDPAQLEEATLRRLAHEFIMRERGNDWDADADANSLIDSAIKRIIRKELLITFNSFDQSVGVTDSKLYKKNREGN